MRRDPAVGLALGNLAAIDRARPPLSGRVAGDVVDAKRERAHLADPPLAHAVEEPCREPRFAAVVGHRAIGGAEEPVRSRARYALGEDALDDAVAGGADQPLVGAVHLVGGVAARRRASGPARVTVGIAEGACARGRAGDLPIDALGAPGADRAGGAVCARAVEPGEEVPRPAADALAAVAHRGRARDGIHARRSRLGADADLAASAAVVVPGHGDRAGRAFIAGDDVIHRAADADGGGAARIVLEETAAARAGGRRQHQRETTGHGQAPWPAAGGGVDCRHHAGRR